METPLFENRGESEGRAFLARVDAELAQAEEKLSQMDGDREVSKEEYESIKEQAKLAAFLKEMRRAGTFFAEAEGRYPELADKIKTYLII